MGLFFRYLPKNGVINNEPKPGIIILEHVIEEEQNE